MKYLRSLVCVASAAALACALGTPLLAASSARADVGDAAVSSAESAGTASESGDSGNASSSSSQASSSDSAGDSKGEQPEKEKPSGQKKSSAGKATSHQKGGASQKGKAAKGAKAEKGNGQKSKAKAEGKDGKTDKKAKKDEKAKKDSGSDEPKASGEDPAKYARKLSGLAARLNAVPDEIGEAKSIAKAYEKKLARLSKRTKFLQREKQRAQNVLDEMNSELSAGTGATLAMVITGRADFDSIDSRGYLLKKVADGSTERISQIDSELSGIAKREKRLKKQEAAEMKAAVKNHETEVADAISKGNAIAAKIEENVSLMKYAEPDLSSARASLRKESLAAAARWYEFEDALAGNEDVLTFGTGAEFELSEKAFVKKWGAAIDAFYKDNYAGSPLEGHGTEMAQAAWDHKIDPRLCAAVSIIESTGGRYCIKPHNAWGWGAADSDPYGGASGWDSWATAIEAWHERIAGSTTGLATAPTVEELGETYCSSLDWAASVTGEMQKVSAEAE